MSLCLCVAVAPNLAAVIIETHVLVPGSRSEHYRLLPVCAGMQMRTSSRFGSFGHVALALSSSLSVPHSEGYNKRLSNIWVWACIYLSDQECNNLTFWMIIFVGCHINRGTAIVCMATCDASRWKNTHTHRDTNYLRLPHKFVTWNCW